MARERYLVGVTQEELAPPPPPKKLSPVEYVTYIWDNFKWPIVLVGIVLIGLTVMTVQLLTKESPDYTLVIATQERLDTETIYLIQNRFAAYGEDINGDGKVLVEVQNLSMNTQTGMTELGAQFAAKRNMFFAFDVASFTDRLSTAEQRDGFFRPLEVTGPGVSADGRYWDWSVDESLYRGGASQPPHLYFGVRAVGHEQDAEDCRKLLAAYIAGLDAAEE